PPARASRTPADALPPGVGTRYAQLQPAGAGRETEMRRHLFAVALAAVLLAGCGGAGVQPTPAPPTPTPTPAQIAQQSAAAMAGVHSVHVKLDLQGQVPPTVFGFQVTSAEGDAV